MIPLWLGILLVITICGGFYLSLWFLIKKSMQQREKWNQYKNFKENEPDYIDLEATLNLLGIPKQSDKA